MFGLQPSRVSYMVGAYRATAQWEKHFVHTNTLTLCNRSISTHSTHQAKLTQNTNLLSVGFYEELLL